MIAQDAKGWFLLLRDGPLTPRTSRPARDHLEGWEGPVYVMWRESREECLEQLRLHQRYYGNVSLKEVKPDSLNNECNFGMYPDGSYMLINAYHEWKDQEIDRLEADRDRLETELDIARQFARVSAEAVSTVASYINETTLTDPYTCGCGKRAQEAFAIVGDRMYCSIACMEALLPRPLTKSGDLLRLEGDLARFKQALGNEVAKHGETFEREAALKQRVAELEMIVEQQPPPIPQNLPPGMQCAIVDPGMGVIGVSGPNGMSGKCGFPDCCASTGICGSPTHGWGQLDPNGYWEHPCPSPTHKYEGMSAQEIYEDLTSQTRKQEGKVCGTDRELGFACVKQENHSGPCETDYQESEMAKTKDSPLHNSHFDLPTMKELKMDISKRTCPVCKKVLANAKGVQHHQRMTTCGQVMLSIAHQSSEPGPFGPNAHVKVESEKVQLEQISYKKSVALATIAGEVIQTAIKFGSGAAALIGIVYHFV